MQAQRPLVIISEEVESELLTTLILNRVKSGLKVCCVKAPAFGDNRGNQMVDMAILTDGSVIDQAVGLDLENAEIDVLGSCKRIVISKEETTIIDGSGSKENIGKRIEQIRALQEQAHSEYDSEKLGERASKLSGGVGVIKVGGASEVEMREIKDRITDAI